MGHIQFVVSNPKTKRPFYRSWVTWAIAFALIVGGVVLFMLGGDKKERKHAEEVTLPISGTHEGYDYVDLGLPSGLKWATCNVGADTPKESGDHYAWGETSVQINIAQDSCATYKKNIGDIGGTDRDVAHVKWGGDWRMPTKDEFEELRNECDWTWTTHNGKKGYMVTGCNGNSIFLPADASCSYNGKPYGSCGKYWTSTPGLSDHHQSAYNFNIESDNIDLGCPVRWVGFLVRPVFSENYNYDDYNEAIICETEEFMDIETLAPESMSGTLYGHDYVDLGLSVKWATMNVGADSPADVGVHYAWGGVDPMVTWVDEEFQPYKDVYFGENDANPGCIGGNVEYDIATRSWGDGWRMPTEAEFEELINECEWSKYSLNGQDGLLVEGPNGNSIFMPYSFYCSPEPIGWENILGGYWSCDHSDVDYCARYLFIEGFTYDYDSAPEWYMSDMERLMGFTIRPVTTM